MTASASQFWVIAGEALGLACVPVIVMFMLTWYYRRKP